MPKKQSTAAKKARAVQRTTGGKYTAVLAEQVCGQDLDPFGVFPGTCARPPHGDTPCSTNRDWDDTEWRRQANAAWNAEEARRASLTPEQRAEEDRQAFEDAYDDGFTASDAWEDARAYKWED